jgi:hypothetical protein
MPAQLVPNEAIPELAARADSPAMLRALRLLQVRGFLLNDRQIDRETAARMKQLADLGLVDPGYAGPAEGEPFIWVSNPNGERVLRHFEANRRYQVKVHPLAHIAMESLSEADREAVRAAVDALLNRDVSSWPRDQVVHLNPDQPGYLLNVTPDLRAFITVLGPGEIELSDIVREETLRLFLERHRAGGKAG